MSNRTPKRKAIHPRLVHEAHERVKRKTRYMKIRLKASADTTSPTASRRVAAQFECHHVFDLLWVGPNSPLSREVAYTYLRKITGIPNSHIASFNIAECRYVMQRVRADYPRLFTKVA